MSGTPSLFDADRRAGSALISTFPPLCSAEHIRTLPGIEHESDAEIERRLLAGAPWLFYGRQNGRMVFWRDDVRDWWTRYCGGSAFNASQRRLNPVGPTWFIGEMFDGVLYEELVIKPRERAERERAEAEQSKA